MNILLFSLIFLLAISTISVIVCHYSIKVTRYNIKSEKVPNSFNEFKIVHLSDLHSRIFGKDNNRFISKIVQEKPNAIFMTGDMVNGRYSDILNLEELIKAINSKLTNCLIYYIMGNREFRYSREKYDKLKDILKSNNVSVLENSKDEIKIGNESICIYGLNYLNRNTNCYYDNRENYIKGVIKEKNNDINNVIEKLDDDKYNILLVHNPKNFEKYSEHGFDLIFAGHIHGGVIRVPIFNKGVLSPEIKFFPKYDGGVFINGKTYMCVSKGLGYGTIPVRLFNRPEIVNIKLNNTQNI